MVLILFYRLIFNFIFYFNLIKNFLIFFSYKLIFFDRKIFKNIKKAFEFNIQVNLARIKLFQKFHIVEYKLNCLFEKKYTELCKKRKRILYFIKIINKFLKIKNLKNLNNILIEITISNTIKSLTMFDMYDKTYNKFDKIKLNHMQKIKNLKFFLLSGNLKKN